MGETSIEWCRSLDGSRGHTINPIRFRNKATGKVGHFCEKVSPGCKNCYASTMQGGPYLSGLIYIAENRDKGEIYFDQAVLEQVLRRRKPTTYFWNDMTDAFGEWVPDEWIDREMATCALTPQHRHIFLTKRAKRMREYLSNNGNEDDESMRDRMDKAAESLGAYHADMNDPDRWPLPNLILGVSVEDQPNADLRIADLLMTPAACRMLSMEPLLGDVDLTSVLWPGKGGHRVDVLRRGYWNAEGYRAFGPSAELGAPRGGFTNHSDMNGIDWVVVGGESGPGARPCNVKWIRSIVQQCRDAGVSCFVKQLGSNPVKAAEICGTVPMRLKDRKGGDPTEWPQDLRVREFPDLLEMLKQKERSPRIEAALEDC